MATKTQQVLDEKGRRIRELTAMLQKRFNCYAGPIKLYAEKVATHGVCAIAKAESLRYKLTGGLVVLRFIMETGAKGCEVVVSGKLRGLAMKFVDGLMIHSGDPCNGYAETATRHVLFCQGVSRSCCHTNKIGPKKPLSDNASMVEPKEEKIYDTPETEYKIPPPTKPLEGVSEPPKAL